jgi:glycosyltransferase involved in cell wall biosynthesis
MKICLICVEIFAWGKYGGFGKAARTIGRELVRRGIEVCAVVPLQKGQRKIETLDGFTVLGFPPHRPWKAKPLLKNCNADIYHSCEPSFTSYLALKTLPHKKHIVTIRDPRDFSDWKIEFGMPSLNRFQVFLNYLFENNMVVRRSIQYMDGVYATAHDLAPKVKRIYRLKADPLFLPTPVSIPGSVEKTKTPTVCYLARLDRRKRPTLFLDLAKRFPRVKFIVIGKSRDKKWESYLRNTYRNEPNLEFMGFVDPFNSVEHGRLLGQSWVMVNTAAREGLPNSFLEAAANQCAILSHVNPDGFASRFGYHAQKDDFEEGLHYLLADDTWRKCGKLGFQYVKDTFEIQRSIQMHTDIYSDLLVKKDCFSV